MSGDSTVATNCARCGVAFKSEPDNFISEDLENEIAAHQATCIVVNDDDDESRGPKETTYDELISPLMSQIIALCNQHKINMAAQFALDANDEDRTMFCTTCLHNADPADSEGVERMRKLRAVMNPGSMFAAFTIISGESKQ